MRYLIRSQAVQIGFTLWALGLLACVLLADVTVPIFNLFASGFGRVPAALLLPTVTAVGILSATSEVSPAQLGAARPVTLWLRTLILAAVALAIAISWCALELADVGSDGSGLSAVMARNLLILVGLGLIGRRIFGSGASTMLPVAYVLLAMVFGNRTRRSWDLILAETSPPAHLVLGAVILVLGLLIGCSKEADRKCTRVS